MIRIRALFALLGLTLATPLQAQATDFVLVNGTDQALGNLEIRRTGSSEWQPLGAAPARGAQSSIAFSNPDCAFDIKAAPASGEAIVWSGVNLCEVNAVTLKLVAGTPFAEYR
ncbi:hypothetical protein [Sphingomicrobium marinum]|uniref:hypothetical protein n=1 Tax=Sphingomicrobium marinum TaxID=1227950 RepID=UPI00223EAAA1|nr:hypothetical protein [Sphingomicrobium marinum]